MKEIEKRQNSVVGKPLEHESAAKHVSGTSIYVDDMLEPHGTLHIAPGWCQEAVHADLKSMDVSDVRSAPGVITVLTAEDIPGVNDASPSFGGDPVLESELIRYHGQVLFAVVAETREMARSAARLARFEFEPKKPLVTIADALESDSIVLPDYSLVRGWPKTKLKIGVRRLSGNLAIGGQEHFYLEGQVALAVPNDENEMLVHSSTQHPTEVQHIVANMLDIPLNQVTVECRRMGGGFGGKESQANQWAALAALGAKATGRPCKIRLDRDEDMIMTGKRHDFHVKWDVALEIDGAIKAVEIVLISRCGHSVDLSLGVNDRAVLHSDSAYYFPAAKILSRRLKTNTCSNTAFRGFGGPQGMLAAERILDSIAIRLAMDPLDVRKKNLYRKNCNVTPYNMEVEEYQTLHDIIDRLEKESDYRERRRQVQQFNSENHVIKKGIALTPVKFGISFTKLDLNQAGALVNLYTDGTIQLNHGGTEMGQGLHTKVAQIVAEVFGLGIDRVKVAATNTGKVPNTSPTAASASTDLNGMAAKNAAEEIKDRLIAFTSERYQTQKEKIEFREEKVFIGNRSVSFEDIVRESHLARVQLSATGFHATPEINWERERKTGKPFHYFAFGAACSEVLVDILTGEIELAQVDIIHDVGSSINSELDKGQIEGGFVQGLGWLTSEELVWDDSGRLLTHSPSTYKIPTVSSIPEKFNVEIWESKGNPKDTVFSSKAVGEPPLMLAISAFCAIGDAIASLRPRHFPNLDAPATPESIMKAIKRLKSGGM